MILRILLILPDQNMLIFLTSNLGISRYFDTKIMHEYLLYFRNVYEFYKFFLSDFLGQTVLISPICLLLTSLVPPALLCLTCLVPSVFSCLKCFVPYALLCIICLEPYLISCLTHFLPYMLSSLTFFVPCVSHASRALCLLLPIIAHSHIS